MGLQDLFKDRQEAFTRSAPASPAEKGAAIWAGRDGFWIIQNKKLRKIIMGLIVLNLFSNTGLVIQSLKATVEPYVIEVNPLTGETKKVGKLEAIKYDPNEASIKYFLKQFIQDTRQIGLDPVAYTIQQNKAHAFLTENAAAKMSAERRTENRDAEFGKKTVQIQIISMLPVKDGGNSYLVKWNEEEFSIGSATKKIVPMSGIFTYTIIQPKNSETIEINPFGIYFSDFNFTKDSTTANQDKK